MKNALRRLARYGCAGLVILSAAAAVLAPVALNAQTPAASSIKQFDPAAAQLISSTANVETLKNEYFAFVEGPVWVPEGQSGYLLFSDIPCNCIYKWQNGALSVFLEKSGFTGTDFSTVGMENNNGRIHTILLGSNGLTLDLQGRLIVAQHGDRSLARREKNGAMTVLADRYEGKRLNAPNDVVVKSNGSIFFTDLGAGLRGGFDKSPLKELDFRGVFVLKDGKLVLVAKEAEGEPANGLALSPDEKTLYVTAGRKLAAYDVRPDDTLANMRVIFNYDTVTTEPGRFDGIKVDTRGNIWASGPAGAWAISPAGKALAHIRMPEGAVNLAFGDADGKSLYVVARRGLYRVRLLVAGIHPIPK